MTEQVVKTRERYKITANDHGGREGRVSVLLSVVAVTFSSVFEIFLETKSLLINAMNSVTRCSDETFLKIFGCVIRCKLTYMHMYELL